MRKPLLILAAGILAFSLLAATTQFKEKTGQNCDTRPDQMQRVHWVWQWWAERGDDEVFILCAGSSAHVVYRPLDVAVVGFLVASGLTLGALKRRPQIRQTS